jgi:hypothetical protein
MTTLGKILAIVNLVLSLAVAGFIVMSYAARTNWHRAYEDLATQLKSVQADTTAIRNEAETYRGDLLKAQTALKQKDAEIAQTTKMADDRVKAEQQKTRDEIAKNAVLRSTEVAMKLELDRRDGEVKYLKGMVLQRDTELAAKERQVQKFRNDAVEALIAAKSEHERNNNLLEQVQTLTKAVQTSQKTGLAATPGAAPKNPPSEDVEGLIKATDPSSGYVTITIGSDAGIAKGNTLEVYRLRPDPAYLGTIQILAVRPDEAVGKPTTRTKAALQVGDRVSSYIVRR